MIKIINTICDGFIDKPFLFYSLNNIINIQYYRYILDIDRHRYILL